MRFTISLSLLILCLYVQDRVVARTAGTTDIKKLSKYGWFGSNDPEINMKACELAKARGFMCEEHEVETKDGYILTLHRIPGWMRNNCVMNDKVLLLQHGFLGSSTNFLINSQNQSLGYLFADACFDVWLANSRGNIYSLKHNTYTSKQNDFWKFSFDEMAAYDLPAVVDYILKKTSQKSLYYVGHSQGATIGLEAFSENKQLAKKIRFFGALAPTVYVDGLTSSVATYAKMSDETIHMMHGDKMFLGPDWTRETFIKTTCANSFMRSSCVKLGESLGGKFSSYFNTSRIAVYFMHTPAGGSVQNLIHWAQILRSKEVKKFDYGNKMQNLAKYGSMKPPKMNFTNVDVPIGILSGNNDIISDPTDIKHLLNELPNVIGKISITDYSHLDFLYATNAEKTLFNPLLFLMKYY